MSSPILGVEDIIKSFEKLNPLEHEMINYWHYFRFNENPVIALYIPRIHMYNEVSPFDYEYLFRIVSVIKTLNSLRLRIGNPPIDVYLSTRLALLPEKFHSKLPCLVLEPTNYNFSVVHKGEALIKAMLKLKFPFISSNLWDQELLLDTIQKVIWGTISLQHKYYPVSRGQDIIVRDIFLLGAPVFSLKELQIENDYIHLSFKVVFPPEITENHLIEKFLENIENTYYDLSSIETNIIVDAARVIPDKKIHVIAEEAFREIYLREPEYEWFPFPTVFNVLSKNNKEILAIGPHSHINLTKKEEINISEIEEDKDLDKFVQFISRLILKLV
ncbi:MAG: hypothetical protein QXZ48_08240 [Zestosphaera sp.]|uniref:hypothetical protein n=1 Tax=Saccharolobus sp. TaxID=2100761 RepID=UPI00317524A8